MAFPHLFAPLHGDRTKDEIQVTRVATTGNLDGRSRVSDRLVAFFRTPAGGGVGTIVAEACAPRHASPMAPRCTEHFPASCEERPAKWRR